MLQRCLTISGAIVVLATFAWPLSAPQSLHFRVYLSPEGRPLERVRDLCLSENGTIWVATWGTGVRGIRGTEWRTFDVAHGVPSSWVRSITKDGANGVWVGATDGLCRIRSDFVVESADHPSHRFEDDSITSVEWLREREVWVSTEQGRLLSYRPPADGRSGSWSVIADETVTGGDWIEEIFQDNSGAVWIALESGGVLSFRDGKVSEYGLADGLEERIKSFFQDGGGTLWGAGGKTLFSLDGERWRKAPFEEGLPARVGESAGGELVVAAWRGLFTRDDDGWRALELKPSFLSARVRAIAPGEDTLWLGAEEGLILGSIPTWRRESPESRSGSFFASPDCAPLMVDGEGHLVEFDGESWHRRFPLAAHTKCLDWAQPPREGKLWAFCNQGAAIQLSLRDGATLRHVPVPTALKPRGLFQTSSGALWLLTSAGIFRLDGSEWKLFPEDNPRYRGRARSISEAPDGSLFVCFQEDVQHWRDGEIQSLSDRFDVLRGQHFGGLHCARDGRVWIGTFGSGIFVYDGSSLEQFSTENGLLSDHVLTATETDDGTIWIAYREQGIASYSHDSWTNFDHRFGLTSFPVNRIFEDPDGSIWAVSYSVPELYRHTPDTQPPETYVSPVQEAIPYNGSGVFMLSGVDSWHRTSREDLRYSWRIRPRDDPSEVEWSRFEPSITVATPPLSAGEYVFEARAMDQDYNIDASPRAVTVVVDPPFWLLPGFLVPVIGLAALAGIMLILGLWKHSALRSSETLLRTSKVTLAEAQRIAQVGSWEWSAPAGAVICSEEARRILGLAVGETEFSWESFLAPIHPADREQVENSMEACFQERVPFSLDHRVVSAGSGTRVVHQEARAERDRGGQVIRVAGTVQDITDRKLLEARIEQAHKLESLGVLAGGIAHDFNNLLMGVLGNAELALREVNRESPAHRRLKDIEIAANRAAELTRQLLAYAGRGGSRTEEDVDLSELVQEMSRLLRAAASDRVDLQFQLEESRGTVRGDATQIRQLVMNLITNAVESCDDRENGRIRLTTVSRPLGRSYLAGDDLSPGEYVVLEVEDNGCGMSEETLQNMFDPFYTTKFRGRGLGLAGALGIVRQHRGAIRVESRIGEGTRLAVVFPTQPKQAESIDEVEKTRSHWSGVGTVLVADDEETVRDVVKLALEPQGFQVILARDGLDAVAKFRDHADALQAVVLDMTMPLKNGYDAYREMEQIRRGVPCIFCSGYTEEDVAVETSEIGPARFLQKPYTPETLLSTLHDVLGEAQVSGSD